jgi:transposase
MGNISKEKLIQLYEVKKMSMKQIAEFFSVSETTIHTNIKKYGIKSRAQKKPKKDIPSKQELTQKHCVDGMTLKDIAIYFGVNRSLVKKWFDYHGIEVNYFKAHLRPEKEQLSRLYVEEKMTVGQLCDIYNVSRKIINEWLTSYGISIRSTQRKYAHMRKVPFTTEQKEFIVGTLLGDAYLSNNNVLQIKHGHKQLDYLLWKKKIMSNYVNNVDRRESDLGICYRWHSITHHEFGMFRKMFYSNNKKFVNHDIIKFFTAFAFAIWYMDDGWRQKNSMKISSESFTLEDHKILQDIIKVKFGINAKICFYNRNGKKYNYLSFNKRNSILLTKILRPYIIESMLYKLLPIDDPLLND